MITIMVESKKNNLKKKKNSMAKEGILKGKDRHPTINFEVRFVSFKEGPCENVQLCAFAISKQRNDWRGYHQLVKKESAPNI